MAIQSDSVCLVTAFVPTGSWFIGRSVRSPRDGVAGQTTAWFANTAGMYLFGRKDWMIGEDDARVLLLFRGLASPTLGVHTCCREWPSTPKMTRCSAERSTGSILRVKATAQIGLLAHNRTSSTLRYDVVIGVLGRGCWCGLDLLRSCVWTSPVILTQDWWCSLRLWGFCSCWASPVKLGPGIGCDMLLVKRLAMLLVHLVILGFEAVRSSGIERFVQKCVCLDLPDRLCLQIHSISSDSPNDWKLAVNYRICWEAY